MSDDENYSVRDDGSVVLAGRYDGVPMTFQPSQIGEVLIDGERFYNALDVLEIALHIAWSTDPSGTAEVLSNGFMPNGFDLAGRTS